MIHATNSTYTDNVTALGNGTLTLLNSHLIGRHEYEGICLVKDSKLFKGLLIESTLEGITAIEYLNAYHSTLKNSRTTACLVNYSTLKDSDLVEVNLEDSIVRDSHINTGFTIVFTDCVLENIHWFPGQIRFTQLKGLHWWVSIP